MCSSDLAAQKDWVKAIPAIQYSLAHTPCHDTHLSPASMLLGHVPRNPKVLVQRPPKRMMRGDEPLDDKRLAALRQRKMDKWLKENSADRPKRPYHKEPQTFEEGDMVRMRSEKPQAEATRRGVPPKWVFRWHDKGVVVGPEIGRAHV